MQYTEITSMTDEKLVHTELQIERELVATRFRHKTGQLEDSSQLSKLRKDIARIRTAQSAREKEQGLANGALKALHSGTFKAGALEAAAASAGGFLKGIVDKVKKDDE